MSKINNQIRKSELARALATGATVTDWATANDVKPRTAYTWSCSPEVVDEVESIRRAALDQSIGRLSKNATDATDAILRLVKEARSESVRLQAARAVLSELMTLCSYTTLERRMAEIERRLEESRVECGGWSVEGTARSDPATLHPSLATSEEGRCSTS
jgi:hypothetical protein